METIESVAPAARIKRYGWNARHDTGPIRWPRNPSWYLMRLSSLPSSVETLIFWFWMPLFHQDKARQQSARWAQKQLSQ